MPIYEVIPTSGVPIKVFTNQLEAKARAQLILLAESGFAEEFVAAMPDVHYGLGATIGSVFASSRMVCPNAVGVDIGCGMAAVPFPGVRASELGKDRLWELHALIKKRIPTGMTVHDQAQWAPVLDDPARTPWLSSQLTGRALRSLGTLGGGNHFIEIVHDPEGGVWAMLHSGSRNLGKITADRYNDKAKAQMAARGEAPRHTDLNALLLESPEGQEYILDMQWCQKFALANRQAMLEILGRIMEESTGVSPDWSGMVNIHHNFCSCEKCRYQNQAGEWLERELWITRKGATSARQDQRGLIPGSMAVGSWLVQGQGNWESWYSCSHGAGRQKSRTASFTDIHQKDFELAMLGIVAETVPELRDEAPQAYKDLGQVMEWQRDLVTPVRRLLPLVNVKGWDRTRTGERGSDPATRVKVPVMLKDATGLGLQVEAVEVHLAEKAEGKPTPTWVGPANYVMRLGPNLAGSERMVWVRSPATHPGKKVLVECAIESADPAGIVLRMDRVKKTLSECGGLPPL